MRDPAASIRDGAQAGTCTRCLRIPPADVSTSVNETFLLEVPEAVAQAVAADVTAEVTCRRLHVANRQERQLTQGVSVVVLLHEQTAIDAAQGVLASGAWDATPEWLRRTALSTMHVAPAGASDSEGAAQAASAVPLSCEAAGSTPGKYRGLLGATIGVRAQLQRVAAWVDDSPTAHELRTSRSQRGYRSLRLAGSSGQWQPVVRDGMQHAATGTGALSGSMLGLNIGSGVALEESFARGVRQETIRSTVQVANDCDFAIQARLHSCSDLCARRG
jgi:hypothetical protein